MSAKKNKNQTKQPTPPLAEAPKKPMTLVEKLQAVAAVTLQEHVADPLHKMLDSVLHQDALSKLPVPTPAEIKECLIKLEVFLCRADEKACTVLSDYLGNCRRDVPTLMNRSIINRLDSAVDARLSDIHLEEPRSPSKKNTTISDDAEDEE